MNIFKRIRYWWLTRSIEKQKDILEEIEANIRAIDVQLSALRGKPKLAHFETVLRGLLISFLDLQFEAEEQIHLDELYRDDIVAWRYEMGIRLNALQEFAAGHVKHLERQMEKFANEARAFIDDYNRAHPGNPV